MLADSLVQPVVAGHNALAGPANDNSLILRQVVGTSFSIGKGFFLTAAHVMHAAGSYPSMAVGFRDGATWGGARILDSEIDAGNDVAVFHAVTPEIRAPSWTIASQGLLQGVATVGYPYALDIESGDIQIRAFSGHIVTQRKFRRLNAHPAIYELSFSTARGHSGAPLYKEQGLGDVCGMVIGNESTEMLVYSDRETITDERKEVIVEHYERFQVGIALTAETISSCHFALLDGTVRSHLEKQGLLH